MKIKKAPELRELSNEDLLKIYREATKEAYSVKIKVELNTSKQTHLIKQMRRFVATIATIANEKNIILK